MGRSYASADYSFIKHQIIPALLPFRIGSRGWFYISMVALHRRHFFHDLHFLLWLVRFGFHHVFDAFDERIGIEGNAVNALVYKELRKFRHVAGRLPTEANFDAFAPGGSDGGSDEPHHGWIFFVEKTAHQCRIPVEAKGELRQIVGANGEPIEYFSEFFRHEHIARNLDHDINFEPVFALFQPKFAHGFYHQFAFFHGAAERGSSVLHC